MSERDLHDLAAAYALGAVDDTERAALDALYGRDDAFRREVDHFREVSGQMALALPPAPPPTGLRDRILGEARQVRPIASAASRAATAAPTRRWTRVIPWMAVAASCTVAAVTWSARGEARSALVALGEELRQVRGELAETERTLNAFLGPEVHVVSLAEAEAKPSARVFWNHTRNVFIVTAFNVPRAPDGKTYQLWAIVKGQQPVSMGTFNTDADGRATVIVPVTTAVNGIDVVDLCAMTLEPAGGSPQPTETPRLVGSWRHTD